MDTLQLQMKAAQLRRDVARMIGVGKVGHLGGSCSLADIVTVLYYDVMKLDPANPALPDRDRFLLSKGHAALIQYAALGDLGFFPREEEATLKKLGSRLQGHPDLRKLPGIEANTGSLGQGLSMAAGIAAGLRMDGIDARVYCCLGDGELAEGQIWEAVMAAGVFALHNLIAILDWNTLQATGAVQDRFNTAPYRDKFEAFRWNVIELDGHDIDAIRAAFTLARGEKTRPTILLAHTVKGKGFCFAENVVSFHNGALTQAQLDEALAPEREA
jgi:transketolase